MILNELLNVLKEKKFLVLVGLLLVLLVGYALLNLPKEEKPKYPEESVPRELPQPKLVVTRVEPKQDRTDVSTAPTIRIYFDRPITKLAVKIEPNPSFSFKETLSPEAFHLTLVPEVTLASSTKYTINVKLEDLTIYSWSFTTGGESTPAAVVENIKKELPYKGDHFKISYWSSTDKFFVTVDAKPVEVYKAAALNWFKARGLTDPEAQINIAYILVGQAAD